MKQKKYIFYKCVVVIGLLSLVFFNCAKISILNSCVENEDGVCIEKRGKTHLLQKKPVDILIVLDNSPKGQKLNPQVTDNLNQLVSCVEPLDWRVGIIAGAENKNSPLGKLIHVERPSSLLSDHPSDHPLGSNKFISSDTKDYKEVFANTVSLSSGCDKPPFCHKGKRKPLSALMAFMQDTEEKELFLRESSHLAVVVVSSSDEKGGFFSGPKVSSQDMLSTISVDYRAEQWVALLVTDAEQEDDCIRTAGDFKRKGMDFLAKTGDIVGIMTMNPLIMLGSATLSYHANKKGDKGHQLYRWAQGGGGQAFDICKPFFGRAVAYSILKSVERESQFPEKCKQFEKSQMADLPFHK